MASLRLRYACAFVFSLAYACSANEGSADGPTGSEAGGGSGPLSVAHGAGRKDVQASEAGKSEELGHAAGRPAIAEDGVAGAVTEDAAGGAATLDPRPDNGVAELQTTCDVHGGCISACGTEIADCGVESVGFACEFEGFVGATARVACGQRVVIGTACCGGCGCVPVEVFFDGSRCWQGVPQCALSQFKDQLLDPHTTASPNPYFASPTDVPGNFYLGSGGIGGSAAGTSSGTAGMSGGASAGADSAAGSGAGAAPDGTPDGAGGSGGSGSTAGGAQSTAGAPDSADSGSAAL